MRSSLFLAALAGSVVSALPGTSVNKRSPCKLDTSSSSVISATPTESSSLTPSSTPTETPGSSTPVVSSSSSTPVVSGSSTPIDSSSSTPVVSLSSSTPIPSSQSSTPSHTPTTSSETSVCTGNTPTTRNKWCDYDIDTDYTVEVPDTGVTREYWLTVSDVTVAPDGRSRSAIAFNGTIPGPTLFADWGDKVKIHVTNNCATSLNGSSIHWHGIRQNYTNPQDGVPSITQCPLAVGETTTYEWKAEQYGSTWYHSHFALQAWQGAFGGLIINGPATANYDEDLGVVMLNDWDIETVDFLDHTSQIRGPPEMDNGLINGTNVYGLDTDTDQTGSRLKVKFDAGTSYRMRLVGSSVQTHWKFSIDNHTMKVIASDLVPIVPYETTVIDIGMGQRYDIIVTADQADLADNFWMRAIPQGACSDNSNSDNIRGIVHYTDTADLPTTTGYAYVDSCDDESDSLVPYISKQVQAADETIIQDASVGRNAANLNRWYLNSTTMIASWDDPTLQSIMDGNTTYEDQEAVFDLPNANEWVYFLIETGMPVPHPIHLHGHDFFVLAQGTGTFSANATVNLDNPPRRDTAMLPASGYLLMAWETDNPGVWLMHCHIGFHASEGFAVQFVERASEIPSLFQKDEDYVDNVCLNWNAFQTSNLIEQHDSGI